MKNSYDVLCNCAIILSLVGNALSVCKISAILSSSDDENARVSKKSIRTGSKYEVYLISFILQDIIQYHIASANINGTAHGPARVALIPFGRNRSTCTFFEKDRDVVLTWIDKIIRDKSCNGREVILTDKDGTDHTITFNNEDDAECFTEEVTFR